MMCWSHTGTCIRAKRWCYTQFEPPTTPLNALSGVSQPPAYVSAMIVISAIYPIPDESSHTFMHTWWRKSPYVCTLAATSADPASVRLLRQSPAQSICIQMIASSLTCFEKDATTDGLMLPCAGPSQQVHVVQLTYVSWPNSMP